MLFHWSPTTRRKQIIRRGLVPGSRSVDGLWRPPYVAFADTPSLAFALAKHREDITSWDLWMVWKSSIQGGFEMLPYDDGEAVNTCKEYRVYDRIWKRDCWYVGTRLTSTR